jgi:hypothetical protein
MIRSKRRRKVVKASIYWEWWDFDQRIKASILVTPPWLIANIQFAVLGVTA